MFDIKQDLYCIMFHHISLSGDATAATAGCLAKEQQASRKNKRTICIQP